MVPSGPTTGPGVTGPSRFRRQRSTPAVGPEETEAPLCLASCNAEGQGAQLRLLGAPVGNALPAAAELVGGFGVGEPPTAHAAATAALIAIASRVPGGKDEVEPATYVPYSTLRPWR